MADRSKIEWTDTTWSPIAGCTPVSPGCANCYAANMAHRFRDGWGKGLTTDKGHWSGKLDYRPEILSKPHSWKRPRKIFVCSGSDLFHENVPFEFIAAVFGIMASARRHTFQVLTKRPARMIEFFARLDERSSTALKLFPGDMFQWHRGNLLRHLAFRASGDARTNLSAAWPLPNVWLGVSVEDQERAAERIPLLLQCPASIRWLSCEPLLGPLDVREWLDKWRTVNTCDQVVDWVVAGGESGPGARYMERDWARTLRDQCAEAGVPFLFKQNGAFDDDGFRVGKSKSGRLLDGALHDAYPKCGSQP